MAGQHKLQGCIWNSLLYC